MTMLLRNGLRTASLLLLFALFVLPLRAEPTVTLNLKDADIRTLIETVAKATGKNFIVDKKVKAQVTVISSRPMEKEELYEVFLSILEVHGYSAVPVGDVIKIVLDASARQQPVRTANGNNPGVGDEFVTRVIQVNHVPAAQLVPILRPLVPQQGQLAAYPATNILLVSDRAGNIERLANIVRRIDRADSGEIEVIPLQHAGASEVVRIIDSLQQKDQKGAPVPGQPNLAADERTNSILLSGDRAARLRIRGIIAHLDTPLESGGNTQVVFLRYAKAKDLMPLLQGIIKSTGTTGGGGGAAKGKSAPTQEADTNIQADEVNNALVITASSAQQRELISIVHQLDIRRAQVLVEGIIAEVSTDLSTELGIQAAVDGSRADNTGPVGLTNFGGKGTSIVGLAKDPTSIGLGLSLGIADLRDGKMNFGILLRALSGDAATNILSTPTLVTLDNEEAEFVVAQEVPFKTGSYTGGDSGTSNPSNPFQTIQRKDVGITLKITPQINEGDTVKLSIDLESSQLAASSEGAVDLITNRRAITTNVLVEDGKAVILSGLIEDRFTDSISKVPLLGDIPVLGHLFKYTSTGKVKQNMMIFIHPVILRDAATTSAYTNAKYNFLKARQYDSKLDKRGLLRDGAYTLPEISDLVTNLPRPTAGESGDAPDANTPSPNNEDTP